MSFSKTLANLSEILCIIQPTNQKRDRIFPDSFFLSFPFTMGGIILRDVPLSSIQPSLRLGFLRLTFGPLPPISSRDPVSRIKRIVKSRGIFFLFLSLSFSNPRLRNWHFRDRQVGECNKRRRIEPPLKDSLLAASQVRVFEPNFLATSK